MKKTRILTVLTAAMIITTSAATYAVWDQVEATSTGHTVTLRNPVTIEDATLNKTITAEATTLNPASITASGEVTFNIENEDQVAKSLTLSEKITAAEVLAEHTDYTITYSGTGVSGKTDSSVTDGAEAYNYTITFTESGLTKLEANGNQCTVDVTATLA